MFLICITKRIRNSSWVAKTVFFWYSRIDWWKYFSGLGKKLYNRFLISECAKPLYKGHAIAHLLPQMNSWIKVNHPIHFELFDSKMGLLINQFHLTNLCERNMKNFSVVTDLFDRAEIKTTLLENCLDAPDRIAVFV